VKEVTESEKSAFMLASVNVVKPDEMGPYMQKCGPLFAAAGIEVVALGVTDSSPKQLSLRDPQGLKER
jgi:hypothetical protein